MLKNKKLIIKNLCFLLMAVDIIIFFSKATSPIYDGTYSTDDSVFKVIGKGILEGYTPYKDLFDHKGPILFLIQALGLLINKNVGIFILQILNLFVTIIYMDKIIELLLLNKKNKKIIFFLATIFFGIYMGEGNLSEEWSIALITIQLYIICKMMSKDKNYSKYYFITGIIFSTISLIRLNNAATSVGFITYIFFYFIVRKDIKELLKICGWFVLGCFLVYFPIFVWFYKVEAIPEMIYGTLTFNFIYSASTNINSNYIIMIINKVILILPLIVLLIEVKASSFESEYKKCFYSIIFWNAVAVSVGYAYLHYYMILVPLFIILIILLFNSKPKEKKNKKIINIVKYVIIIYISIMYLLYVFMGIIDMFQKNLNVETARVILDDVEEIKEIVKNEKEILCYNTPARIYLLLDKMPSCKYFTMQEWHSMHDSNINKQLEDFLTNGNIEYIITDKNFEKEWLSNYKLIYNNHKYNLYKLRK